MRAPYRLNRLARLAALLGAVLLVLGLTTTAAQAAPADDPVPAPAAGRPWFGPGLDWSDDLPADYADRLGETPSLYAQRVHYPLTDDDETYLEQFAQQSATQGAVAVLTLEPQEALAGLTDDDATELAGLLARLHTELDSYFLVRFAPEMNGSWVTWGQQPEAYVAAFRTVADAVHAATDHAAMVWAPAYGAGYPFGAAFGAVDPSGQRSTDQLDTNGDLVLDETDDPYGPYFPGADSVDWVGLSLYDFGVAQDFGGNVVPGADAFQQRLDETLGYGDDRARRSFYERFAAKTDTPLLVETAALFNPDDDGAREVDVKREWWRQVFAASVDHPLIGAISWLELDRPEAEVDDETIEWGATRTAALSRALRADLRTSSVDMGPVTRVVDQQAGNVATAQGRLPAEDDAGSEMGWIVFCAALLAIAFVLAGAVGRWVPSWRYPNEHDPRDQRLDLFRGWIIITVVVTHVEVAGPWSFVSLNAIGAITGAEMFVLLSGVVLGMIYAPTVRKVGEWGTAVLMWKRARKQYLVALAVVGIVYVLGVLPFVDGTDITTFTDRGTGEDGTTTQGTVYDLYANAPRLFDYPPPWYAVKQFLLLEMGPWVFNIMGLFVVLSLLLPAIMWFIQRRLWWLVLAVSWAAFVYGAMEDPHWLPSQFEYVFPLLTWQVAFTHGLVLGRYRAAITRALTTISGKVACTVFVLGYAGALVWLWATHHYGWSTAPFPAGSYDYLYTHGYTRIFLQPGRLVDLALMIVVAYAFLTTCWKPVNKVVGWFWIPMGQASLYVFIVHVFFALAVGNIPGVERTSVWQGALIHTAIVLLIWLMVKKKFLFSVIPR